MKWVKIGQVTNYISLSEQKIRQLIHDDLLEEGIHYVKNPHIGHTLFNLEALEKWLLQDVESTTAKHMKELLKEW
ncbi:hypothetical protein [Sulfurovum sp. NBC37-1]|uniref:hypothetical protein n=1 Tax=Sulfurovum sp. (strain NBC37-1) TaxID=387093 RepID=UPI00015879DE|nr:hypothetical protein [Sulfurovum sp. NBC37-1]BAF72390.1 hypothetical protein SUN_1439 [Sulfurovum sp. NBC37-1]